MLYRRWSVPAGRRVLLTNHDTRKRSVFTQVFWSASDMMPLDPSMRTVKRQSREHEGNSKVCRTVKD